MAAEQCSDAKVTEFHKQPGSLNLIEVNIGGCIVLCDVSTARPRPIVPPRWTKIVFETVHNLSHPGHKPTTRAIWARYVWPGLKREVKNMVHACHSCQASKLGRRTKTALKDFESPDRRFGDIHVDHVGPLPSSEGCPYLFRMVERFTRWPEAIPIHNAETITCATARALLRNWISRFGAPYSLTFDQGPQFTSGLWHELHKVFGCKPKARYNTSYPPQCNGMVERFHRRLNAALKALLLGPCWVDELPVVLLGIRSTWKEGLEATPALLTYETNLRIPDDFPPSICWALTSLDSFKKVLTGCRHSTLPTTALQILMSRVTSSQRSTFTSATMHIAAPCSDLMMGPSRSDKQTRSDKHFDILRSNKPTRVSIDRLKLAYFIYLKPAPSVVNHLANHYLELCFIYFSFQTQNEFIDIIIIHRFKIYF